MRKILFRGKRVDNGEWIYGFVYYDSFGRVGIVNYSDDFYFSSSHLVIPETVSQFTGLTDKNGNDIFEGDVVRKRWCQSVYTKDKLSFSDGVVEFTRYSVVNDSFGIDYYATGWNMEFSDKSGRIEITSDLEIIGNIHDKTNDNGKD